MDWIPVFNRMSKLTQLKDKSGKNIWVYGQAETIHWMSDQLGKPGRNGVLIADEVGMGKTRVTMAAILSVIENGGRAVAVVPPGLLNQWKKEWDDFMNSIEDKKQYSPMILRSFFNIFEEANLEDLLYRRNHKWLLVSHQFGPPRIQSNSQSHRYWLPVLAAVIRLRQDGKGLRNKFWTFLRKDEWDKVCLDEICDDCKMTQIKKEICHKYDIQVKRAAEFLARKEKKMFREMKYNVTETDGANEFYKSEEGYKMVSTLLGEFDLIVIDEAHKNRKESGKLETMLSNIIKGKEDAKYIAMTATPMELHADQWEDLFKRIKEQIPHDAIDQFRINHHEANKYHANADKIRQLIEASSRFKYELSPFVTRRLRIRQHEMQKLLNITQQDFEKSSHPYRDLDKVIRINFEGIDELWKRSVFALEALGKAAKGCKTTDPLLNAMINKLRIIDSRYSAGMLEDQGKGGNGSASDEKFSDEEKLHALIAGYICKNQTKKEEQRTIGKLQRIDHWLRILIKGERKLSSHPRIQFVTDEIETVLWGKDGNLKQEKVLVFGTFKKPLHALQYVLNQRAVLRFLNRKKIASDPEPPIPVYTLSPKELDEIWNQYELISANSNLGFKRRFSNKSELLEALEDARKIYDSLRERLRSHIDEKFVMTLPGDASIKSIKEEVADLLRIRIINEMICSGDSIVLPKPNDLKVKAFKFWVDYLENYLDKEQAEEDKKAITEWKKPDYLEAKRAKLEDYKMLDILADNTGRKELTDMVSSEMEELSARLSFFARMLDGGVKMDTRRGLQAQFNSEYSFPQVLIAQSQVGREGLNLHKTCKTVIQFHSEWNPGVVEQQIGRVDRIKSYWEKEARNYRDKNPSSSVNDENYPKIIIKPVVFEGTYDDFQYKVSKRRRENLNAHLFCELLSPEALEKIPNDNAEWQVLLHELRQAAPDFSPPIVIPRPK